MLWLDHWVNEWTELKKQTGFVNSINWFIHSLIHKIWFKHKSDIAFLMNIDVKIFPVNSDLNLSYLTTICLKKN